MGRWKRLGRQIEAGCRQAAQELEVLRWSYRHRERGNMKMLRGYASIGIMAWNYFGVSFGGGTNAAASQMREASW